MITVCIILIILLSILLVAMIVDRGKHPEDYKVPERRKKRRHTSSRPVYGPPWAGKRVIKRN